MSIRIHIRNTAWDEDSLYNQLITSPRDVYDLLNSLDCIGGYVPQKSASENNNPGEETKSDKENNTEK